jgi:hypothetical protein
VQAKTGNDLRILTGQFRYARPILFSRAVADEARDSRLRRSLNDGRKIVSQGRVLKMKVTIDERGHAPSVAGIKA